MICCGLIMGFGPTTMRGWIQTDLSLRNNCIIHWSEACVFFVSEIIYDTMLLMNCFFVCLYPCFGPGWAHGPHPSAPSPSILRIPKRLCGLRASGGPMGVYQDGGVGKAVNRQSTGNPLIGDSGSVVYSSFHGCVLII